VQASLQSSRQSLVQYRPPVAADNCLWALDHCFSMWCRQRPPYPHGH
jgi:hypothetical protein